MNSRTMVWKYLSRAPFQLVVANDERPVSQREWVDYAREAREAGDKLTTPRGSWTLIFSEGGGPNNAQRKDMSTIKSLKDIPCAVITRSVITRGIVTALSWLGKDIRAFAPEDLDRAFEYLAIPASERATTLREIGALRAELLGRKLAEIEGAVELPRNQDPARYMVGESLTTIRAEMEAVSSRLTRLKKAQ